MLVVCCAGVTQQSTLSVRFSPRLACSVCVCVLLLQLRLLCARAKQSRGSDTALIKATSAWDNSLVACSFCVASSSRWLVLWDVFLLSFLCHTVGVWFSPFFSPSPLSPLPLSFLSLSLLFLSLLVCAAPFVILIVSPAGRVVWRVKMTLSLSPLSFSVSFLSLLNQLFSTNSSQPTLLNQLFSTNSSQRQLQS